MTLSITHRLVLKEPHRHFVQVETRIRDDAALPSTLTLFLPVWTPGSYLVREYARHIEELRCDAPARVAKVRKNAWEVTTGGARDVVVRYRVYCNELTVRTNHVDETHAFLNGAALLLAVEGREKAGARVEIDAPEGWDVATSLPAREGGFDAPDYDALVDCPIEVGLHREERFEVRGKPHRLVVWPRGVAEDADVARLIADTRTILDTEAKIFGDDLPYGAYLFLLYLSPRGRGGLEHTSCCSLLASPAAFSTRDGYLDLLSLVAHEAFHAWNVKRIRPAGLTPYRYQEENYTRLLWWFEGATSYYDWRVLRLSKLCTVPEYLDHLASEIGYLDMTQGRFVHSLEEASFDAWIKLYRPDENSQNSSISYYRKGEVVCALLDLEIRARSDGRAKLDDVAEHLWKRFGARGLPVPERGMNEIFEEVARVPVSDLLDAWVRAPGEIDYATTLAKVGLAVERTSRSDAPPASFGARLRSEGARVLVSSIVRGAAAERAGIDPGDELIAVGGKRLESASLDSALKNRREGEVVEVLIGRDGVVSTRAVTLDPARKDRVKLVPLEGASEAARAAFTAWLGEPHPAWGPR